MNNNPIHYGHCDSYNSLLSHANLTESTFNPPMIHTVKSAQIEFDFNFDNQSIHKIYTESLKVDICNFERTHQPISDDLTKIEGEYILVVSWWMNHFGHCMLDILPAYEYIRHLYRDTSFKFLVPRCSPIESILLALDPSFWSRSLETYDPKNGLSLTGSIKIYSVDQYPHRYKGGSIDLINRLKKTNSNFSQTNNEVIFCPRYTDSDAVNGKHQTQEEIEKISKELSSFCKKNNLIFKTFNPKLETGGWMSVDKQRQFFQHAHTVIGLRGSAIHNVIWSKEMIDKNSKPLNIIEFTQCESKLLDYNLAPNDHRLRKGDDLGSWKQYSSDFNSQYYHIFYTIKESEKDYVYIDINELSLTLHQILTT